MNGPIDALVRLDRGLYEAIAAAETPSLDAALRRVSLAANKSVLWIGVAGVLAAFGGPRGRRAAVDGLASIAVASAAVNLGVKQVARRRRPDRRDAEVPVERKVGMPDSTSFPSGHSASAFAFAQAVSATMPWVGVPLRLAAAVVAYSRVHTGVHYPGDVVMGSLIGMTVGEVTARGMARARQGP